MFHWGEVTVVQPARGRVTILAIETWLRIQYNLSEHLAPFQVLVSGANFL
jgi:hypothetical protein